MMQKSESKKPRGRSLPGLAWPGALFLFARARMLTWKTMAEWDVLHSCRALARARIAADRAGQSAQRRAAGAAAR